MAAAAALASGASILLAAVYFFAWSAPSTGMYHDDGVYLVTAKALAEGKGYRIISLPGEIPQTKYPFLFPAALSAVWRLRPDFPRNVPILKLLPLACAIVWFALAWLLMLRMRATRVQALWIVLVAMASPLVVFLSTNLMSETMFAALFTAAMLAAHSVERSRSDRLAWVAGGLAALAFLTRSAGIAPLVAIPVAFGIQRRFGAVWRFTVAGSLACIWPIWVHLHTGHVDAAQLYYSSANYASSNILTNYDLAQKLQVLGYNVLIALASPAALFNIPAPLASALAITLLLGVVCAKKLLRADAIHLSVGAYIAGILCWAWPPPRFVAIVLPVFLLLIWKAIEAITPNRISRSTAVALAGLFSCFLLANDLRRIPQTAATGQFPFDDRAAEDWREMENVFSWLRNNTKPDAVVLANLDPAFFLYTGRKATRDFVQNPYDLFYSSEPSARDYSDSLSKIIESTGASILVLTADRGYAEGPILSSAVARYQRTHPGKLHLTERPGAGPEYRIYEIRR